MPVKGEVGQEEHANGKAGAPAVVAQTRGGANGTHARGAAAGTRALRPREKLGARGAGALSDAELLALVLGSGSARRSALRIGRALARRRPAELAAWPTARWLLVPGVGPARAAALAAAFELGRRAAERGALAAAIRGPDDVLAQVRDLPRARKEHFVVLLLNARHEVQCRETVSIGSLNASIVHPREVFLPAILQSAASVVLVHNHPSGDPEPSEEDLSITRRLVQVGELVGIDVLDHVIVAERGVVSLRARQLL
jgi:DNA repair protein RadC